MSQSDPLLTASEAAERIGVTRAGLSRMAGRGALMPCGRTPKGGRLFDPDEVERIAAARATLRVADRRRRQGEGVRLEDAT
jgi:DNA-binding transcriptional MerR regulator